MIVAIAGGKGDTGKTSATAASGSAGAPRSRYRTKAMNAVIAVPSEAPGGLKAAVSPHFGHCAMFTLVSLRNGAIAQTAAVPMPAHEHGGCLVPVRLLASHGATAIVAKGIGRRPLLGFLEAGIEPYFAADCETVESAIAVFSGRALSPFCPEEACGGAHTYHDRS